MYSLSRSLLLRSNARYISRSRVLPIHRSIEQSMNRPIHQSINRFKQSISLSIAHSLARIHTSFSSQRPLISTRSLARSLAHFGQSCRLSLSRSLTRSLARSLSHSLIRSLGRSIYSLILSLARSFSLFVGFSPTHSLTLLYPLAESPAESFFKYFFSWRNIPPWNENILLFNYRDGVGLRTPRQRPKKGPC